MTVTTTLTVAGSDTGPFNLYSDTDGYVSAFETGVSKVALLAGYTSTLVPNGTTVIRVKSNNELCTNYVDIPVVPCTTTTTTSSTTTINEVLLNWSWNHGEVGCTASYFEIIKNGSQVILASASTGSENGTLSVVAGDVLVINVNTGNQAGSGCQDAYVKYDSNQFAEDIQTGVTNAQITVTVSSGDISYGTITVCGTIGGGACPV